MKMKIKEDKKIRRRRMKYINRSEVFYVSFYIMFFLCLIRKRERKLINLAYQRA